MEVKSKIYLLRERKLLPETEGVPSGLPLALFFLFCLNRSHYYYLFSDRVSMCTPGWPWLHEKSPSSVSQVLGSHWCAPHLAIEVSSCISRLNNSGPGFNSATQAPAWQIQSLVPPPRLNTAKSKDEEPRFKHSVIPFPMTGPQLKDPNIKITFLKFLSQDPAKLHKLGLKWQPNCLGLPGGWNSRYVWPLPDPMPFCFFWTDSPCVPGGPWTRCLELEEPGFQPWPFPYKLWGLLQCSQPTAGARQWFEAALSLAWVHYERPTQPDPP